MADDSDSGKNRNSAAKRGFLKGKRPPGFTELELKFLRRNGRRLNELAKGRVRPSTRAQKQFVDVCRGLYAPVTPSERLWIKYVNFDKSQREKRRLERLRPATERIEGLHGVAFELRLTKLRSEHLRHLFTHANLSVQQRTYLDAEWRRRYPPVGEVEYAKTDGQ